MYSTVILLPNPTFSHLSSTDTHHTISFFYYEHIRNISPSAAGRFFIGKLLTAFEKLPVSSPTLLANDETVLLHKVAAHNGSIRNVKVPKRERHITYSVTKRTASHKVE
jgi:hypothetical protein